MSERKVLNKYYPPDFDPSKIPKLREPKNKTFSIRIMAPFNMRCNVCGEYIYKGKKFNSRKENVEDEDFLGLRIFRFYIRCPKCVAEIAFKTDLKNTDYTLEAGATRLFEAEKLAQQMAEQERLEKEAEELNPMKVLENRTKASHREMAQIDELEELREINARHAKVDTAVLLEKQRLYEEHLLRLQQEEEDRMIQSIFGNKEGQAVKRLADSDSEDEADEEKPKVKKPALDKGKAATDLLTDAADAPSKKQEPKKLPSWQKSVGTLSSKSGLAGLVKKKPAAQQEATKPTQSSATTSSKPLPSSNGKATATSTETQRLVAAALSQQAKAQNAISSSTVNGVTKPAAKADSAANSTGVSVSGAASGNNSTSSAGGSALGLLGGYSDSESGEDSS